MDLSLESDFFYHGLSGLIQNSTTEQASDSGALASPSRRQESCLTSECDLILNECTPVGVHFANLLRQCGYIRLARVRRLDGLAGRVQLLRASLEAAGIAWPDDV